MDSIFNEQFYRFYLENFWPMDETKMAQRKEALAEYSFEYLQKVADDSKVFCMHLLELLDKSKDIYTDAVFTQVDYNDTIKIHGDLLGENALDVLIRPSEYDENFYVSKRLLDMFFGYAVLLDETSLKLSLPKDKFEPYLNMLNNNLIK